MHRSLLIRVEAVIPPHLLHVSVLHMYLPGSKETVVAMYLIFPPCGIRSDISLGADTVRYTGVVDMCCMRLIYPRPCLYVKRGGALLMVYRLSSKTAVCVHQLRASCESCSLVRISRYTNCSVFRGLVKGTHTYEGEGWCKGVSLREGFGGIEVVVQKFGPRTCQGCDRKRTIRGFLYGTT